MEIQTLQNLTEWELLLKEGFPVPEGCSFFDDFPVWRSGLTDTVLIVGINEEQCLVSGAGLRIAQLQLDSGSLAKIGIIGGVVTAQQARGRGLGSVLVEDLIRRARFAQCEAIALFGSDRRFYQKLGFVAAGEQLRSPLHSVIKGGLGRDVELGAKWNPALGRLLMERKTGLQVTERDLPWISAHKNIEWCWAGPRDQPVAFAGVGKGIDLSGMIHEWGGEREALHQLLSALAHHAPSLELLGNTARFQEQGIVSTGFMRDPLCLAMPLTPMGATLIKDQRQFWFWGTDGA